MDSESKTAVVHFAMRALAIAVHEEVKGNMSCGEQNSTGFLCSRPKGHSDPHIACTTESVCHIWYSWEEKKK